MTPTFCRVAGIAPPALAGVDLLQPVIDKAGELLGPEHAERVLVYAPDAIGRRFLEARPQMMKRLAAASDVAVPLRAVLPAKTPVCFASMFTGLPPEGHGITGFRRPVFKCDTLFDALLRAGRRVAIVAVKGSSIDSIFRERELDYFSETYDPEVTARVLELLQADRHDFILAYHQEYDDLLHATAPDSPEAEAAAGRHVEAFMLLCQATDEHWSRHSRVLAFTPDHGAHNDPVTGKGAHGDDVPEDTELIHYWRIRPAAPEGQTERFAGAWDDAADTWEEFVETGQDWYRLHLHGPALLAAVGEVRGRRVLDLGCGQGYFTRRLAEAGARVTGVDLSEKQLGHALKHEQALPLGIEYRRLDAASVADEWPEGRFDLVTACMSLHDMPDPGRTLKAAFRVLASGGRLVFSAPHPGMDVPVRAWEKDNEGRKVAYKFSRYFDEGPTLCHWYMARLNRYWSTPFFRLTIDGWSRLIADAGFLIRRIYEPRPTAEEVERCPEIDDCVDFPSFVIFDLVKPT